MKGEIKMARYKIYDNKSDVITPAGEKLTACLLYTSDAADE